MSAKSCHWAMNQCPPAANSPWQQRCVLILWRHDDAKSLKALEIRGKRKRDPRATARKRCVGHGILLEFGNICDARIFDAPYFFRKVSRICRHRWLRINTPSIDTIRRTSSTKMRQAAAIFNAAKQESIPVGKPYGSGIEDAVNWIRPVIPAKERIAWMTRKQRRIGG